MINLDKNYTAIITIIVILLFFKICQPSLCNSNDNFKNIFDKTLRMENYAETETKIKSKATPEAKTEAEETNNLEITGFDSYDQLEMPVDRMYFIDDGADGRMSIQHNLCSRTCCSEQYPLPFKMKYDERVCNNKGIFVPSNIMCNNTLQDSGCLCMTKQQSDFIYNRGGNAQ